MCMGLGKRGKGINGLKLYDVSRLMSFLPPK